MELGKLHKTIFRALFKAFFIPKIEKYGKDSQKIQKKTKKSKKISKKGLIFLKDNGIMTIGNPK